MSEGKGIDRRRLLVAGALIGGVAGAPDTRSAPADSKTYSGTLAWKAGTADNPAESASDQVYRFFGPDEVAFLEAAIDRLIPPDHNGPGAKEAGVGIFLDRQMGGPYGHGDHFYLLGPWPKGLPTQGYQQRMAPGAFYKAAIPAIDAYARKTHGKSFHELASDKQDAVLKALESGEAKLDGADAKAFFTLFLQNTAEGFWSDPIYGGNRAMTGWRQIGFPGAHYDYSEWVGRHGEPWPYPPVGLKGRPEWSEG